MIMTISLCNTCYKKVPSFIVFEDGRAILRKECDVHGKQEALFDPSALFVSNFYKHGTLGNNNNIIIHVNDSCNMKCPWCYYKPGLEQQHNAVFYHQLFWEMYRGFSLMLSGGEPTLRPDYIEFTKQLWALGWNPSTITNMLKLADKDFFKQTLHPAWVQGKDYRFAMSFQHPKNYDARTLELKKQALQRIEQEGLVASCCMFSIQTLDELDYIYDFYTQTRHLYSMLRIRTMFHNWRNKGKKEIYLSDLYKVFMRKFAEFTPVQSLRVEQSNPYCLYMETKEGRHISLASSPTVENLDYHVCSRPVYMLGPDFRCYPVPICQIVNEGIEKGWKDGFQIKR